LYSACHIVNFRIASVARRSAAIVVTSQFAFLCGKKFCLLGPIGEHEKRDHSDRHGWDCFNDVHDLPACRPNKPSRLRSAVDIGAPIATLPADQPESPTRCARDDGSENQ